MNTQTQTLLDLKDKIETAKTKMNKLQGQKEELQKNLKKEFKCKTIKEAKTLLKTMVEEIEKESALLDKQTLQLERDIERRQ